MGRWRPAARVLGPGAAVAPRRASAGTSQQVASAAVPFNFNFKGMTYDGFPAPYDPSTANNTCIFFGSDAAYDAMKPLWGDVYVSKTGVKYTGRNDLQTMYN